MTHCSKLERTCSGMKRTFNCICILIRLQRMQMAVLGPLVDIEGGRNGLSAAWTDSDNENFFYADGRTDGRGPFVETCY